MKMANKSFIDVDRNTTEDFIAEEMFQIWGVAACMISLIGIPGNLLVILSVLLNKQLRTVPNYLVFNLSICDLVFVSLAVPYHACCYLTGQDCIPELCWAEGFLTNWILGVSVLSTSAIAVNRYNAIVFSSKYKFLSGTKFVIGMCVGVYIVSFLLVSPTFTGLIGSFGYDPSERRCRWEDAEIVMMLVVFVDGIFPLVLMTACYIHILLYVITTRKDVKALGRTADTSSGHSFEKKLSLMLAMVYLVYMLTTFPSFLLNILVEAGVFVSKSLWTSAFVLVWASPAINPIVYGLVNSRYREAYKAVFMKMRKPFIKAEENPTNTDVN